ncbi:MAG TPA: hypothetical protein VGM91_15935 [Conexibacter sp.]|jgi:hypothetical protein
MSHGLGDRLRAASPLDADATARGWEVVRTAHAAREPVARARRARSTATPALIALAAAALLGALALTPAGARVSDWIGRAIDPSPSRPAAVLPAPGRLLVSGLNGTWVVGHDLKTANVSKSTESSWSARGNYIVMNRSDAILVSDASGTLRWELDRPQVNNISWSAGDGYRIAYRSGWQLRVVAGDGSGDRLLDDNSEWARPAWRPGPLGDHELAYARPHGRVILRDVDAPLFSERVLIRSGPKVEALAWSGRDRLLVQRAGALLLIDAHGHVLARQPKPAHGRFAALTASPVSHTAAFVEREGNDRPRIVWTVEPKAHYRLLRSDARIGFAGKASIRSLAFSPDGRWLAFAWPEADQLLFQHVRGRPRLLTVGHVKRRLGHVGDPIDSQVVGWGP